MFSILSSCPVPGLTLLPADGVLTAMGANTTAGYCRFNAGGEIEYLFVGPAYRRKGVATWLLDAVAAHTGQPLFFREPLSPTGRKLVEAYLARQTCARWTPTRAAGLSRLEAFLPHAGRAYAARRNTDFGPQDRANVSQLSPYIRRRLVTEEEVARAALAMHGLAAAEKFVQEVCWRTYWKGWLEQRPHVYAAYCAGVERLTQQCAHDDALAARCAAAMQGATGIDCFDAWARELVATGWLHNHARMWFASIWIFTLELPWQLGADFFHHHLLDADPASNTLSWRWVAGLHTQGKHYVARADNIREHTNGRFDPRGQLNEAAAPLPDDGAAAAPAARLPAPATSVGTRVALLLTDDDLHPESLMAGLPVVGVAALESAETGAAGKRAFVRAAVQDGLQRASDAFAAPAAGVLGAHEIAAWARTLGADEIVAAYAPVGPTARALTNSGAALTRVTRPWDARAWPHAKAGFFKFRQHIPALLETGD